MLFLSYFSSDVMLSTLGKEWGDLCRGLNKLKQLKHVSKFALPQIDRSTCPYIYMIGQRDSHSINDVRVHSPQNYDDFRLGGI